MSGPSSGLQIETGVLNLALVFSSALAWSFVRVVVVTINNNNGNNNNNNGPNKAAAQPTNPLPSPYPR